MKKIFLFLLLFTLNAQARKPPTKTAILQAMTAANGYFMQEWPDVAKPIWAADKTRSSNIWTRAVYYEGLMALYGIDKQKSYYDYAVNWGEAHQWGLRNGTKTRNGDDQACGQTYLDLYLIDPKPERLRDIKATMDNMVASDKINDWTWIDALQMAMPVFARLGVIEKDNRYFEKMYAMYQHTKSVQGDHGLWNSTDKLWYRDKDFDPPFTTPNGKPCYWSRGNGWVVAALVRVLSILPKNAPHWAEYEADYLAMMQVLLPLQRVDGFWNVSLMDENDFGGKELTGTALFTYGMAWGVNNGFLKKSVFKPKINKAMNAMMTESVHPNGFLGFVQGTGKEPKDGQPLGFDKVPNFTDFGFGCFLLAGSEVYKMSKK